MLVAQEEAWPWLREAHTWLLHGRGGVWSTEKPRMLVKRVGAAADSEERRLDGYRSKMCVQAAHGERKEEWRVSLVADLRGGLRGAAFKLAVGCLERKPLE